MSSATSPTVLRKMVREEDRYEVGNYPGYLGRDALLVFRSPEHAELWRTGERERYEHLEPHTVSLEEIDAMLEDLELDCIVVAEPLTEDNPGTIWEMELVLLEQSI